MRKKFRIFVVNPGSTSTKVSLFEKSTETFTETIRHGVSELAAFRTVVGQLDYRMRAIEKAFALRSVPIDSIDAAVGRGGVLHPVPSGTFAVNERMLEDLRSCRFGEHASNLGALIANEVARRAGVPSYIVDPVVVDEMDEISRLSGHPKLERLSIFHALNQKAVAREAARMLGKKYESVNLVVAHLGGGISVGLHKNGRVVDVNNALDGDGPFAAERSGTLPAGGLVDLCFSGEYSREEIRRMLTGEGGLVAHLGTNSTLEVVEMIESGDGKAELVYRAMAYRVSKEIMGLFAGASGKIDAVVLTGGVVFDKTYIVPWIEKMLGKAARLIVIPGEGEMTALALGALRVLTGEEKAKRYK
ncbi:MAG: butyrate kinase [Spirochaetes bacterium]|nr:butyrate kinase [Spirochaetota bacterium]